MVDRQRPPVSSMPTPPFEDAEPVPWHQKYTETKFHALGNRQHDKHERQHCDGIIEQGRKSNCHRASNTSRRIDFASTHYAIQMAKPSKRSVSRAMLMITIFSRLRH